MKPVNACCPICLSDETVFIRPYRAMRPGSEEVFSGLSILFCRTCSGYFADPFPPQEVLDQYYRADYRAEETNNYLERETSQWSGPCVRARSQIEFVLRRANSTRNAPPSIRSWLDVGAGYGLLLDEAKKVGAETTAAIEHDQSCQARLKAQGHTISKSLSDVDNSWEIVSFSHLLEHLAGPREFLRRISSLLANGGYVFCEVPNDLHVQYAEDDAPHLIFFTTGSLKRLFESMAFEIVAIETCGRKHKRGSANTFVETTRRVGRRLFTFPPRLLDIALHSHFHYSKDDNRKWIRLLARKMVAQSSSNPC